MIYRDGLDAWEKSQGVAPDNTKVYVEVSAVFTPDGVMRPVSFVWEDGHRYEISRVKDVTRAASTKAGGAGIRYLCQVGAQECRLYYEENYRWFLERRKAT